MKQILALILLSILWGMEWLRELLIIPHTPAALRSAISLTAVALLLSFAPSRRKFTRSGTLSALGLFVVPIVVASFAHISGYTSATLWTLVPVFVVVLSGARTSGLRQDLLFISIAGVAGALLIFPLQFPASLRDGLSWLLALFAVASVAAASVFAPAVTGISAGGAGLAALLLWIFAGATRTLTLTTPELLWIAAIDLPATLLLLWLLRQMTPVALSTRYLLPVVMTILSSWIALHQQMTLQFGAGLALLAGTSGTLIFMTRVGEG